MKPLLDINIVDTHNIKTIAVSDHSAYIDNSAIQNPVLEITPPGWGKVATMFTPKGVNTYNSNNVGITNNCDFDNLVAMPDGIWKFRYSIFVNIDNYIEKFYLRTTNIQCKYQKAFLKFIGTCDDSTIDKDKNRKALRDISILIDGAVAAANKYDDLLAMDLYHRADKLLDKLIKSKCHGCM